VVAGTLIGEAETLPLASIAKAATVALESGRPVVVSETVPLIVLSVAGSGAVGALPVPHPKRNSDKEASKIAPNVNLCKLCHIQASSFLLEVLI
jgi:hypothetical protein